MNVAFDVMNTLSGTTGSGGVENSKSPAVFLGDNGTGKTGFKEILLSKNNSENSNPNEDLLKKLRQLLQTDPDKLEEKLKQLDSNTLLGLESLLSQPFDSLLQQLQSLNLKAGSDKASLKGLKEAIARLEKILSQGFLESGLHGKNNIDSKEMGTAVTTGEDYMDSSGKAGGSNASDADGLNAGNSSGHSKDLKNTAVYISNEDKKINSSKSGKVSVNLDDITAKSSDNQDEDRFARLKEKQGMNNKEQAVAGNLKNENLNNSAKEADQKDEFSLARVGTKQKDTTINSWNIDQAAQNDLDKADSIGSKSQFNQSGQFNDLMGQGSQQGTGINEANAAKMAVATGSDMAGVIEQITERMQVNHQPDKNQINIQLEPESLGKVNVQLKVENGEVMAKLVVENQQIKGFLEHNLNVLKTNLVRQGFNVDQVYIESNDFNYKEQFDSQQQFHQQQQNQSEQEQNSGEYVGFNYEDMESLFTEEEFSELPQSIISDHRWSNLNYIRHRMNLLA